MAAGFAEPAVTAAYTHTSTKKYLGDALFPRYFYYIFHPNSSLKSRTTVFRHFSKNKLSILVRIILLPNSSLKWMKKAQYRQHLCVFETNLSPQYYNCYFYPKFFAKMDE